jgi:hypothetical protein
VAELPVTLGFVEEPGVVVTVTPGWDAGVVSSVLDGAVSLELEGVVTGPSVVVGGVSEALAHATAPRAPTTTMAVMMPMSLRFMVASFGDRFLS